MTKMIEGIQKECVRKKSELTTLINNYAKKGMCVHRTVLKCNCRYNNLRHSSAIVVDPDSNKLIRYLIRCNECVNKIKTENNNQIKNQIMDSNNNIITAKSPISSFSEETIKKALGNIELNDPWYYTISLIAGMHDFIVFNTLVDEKIKDTYESMYQNLNLYISLIESTLED